MTDKQIIIDGVDVSGCPYYCGHDICKNTCHYFCTPCEWVDVQNCTYKQFKRAEQTVEECHKYQAELEDKLTAKEQECEELKENLSDLIKDLKIQNEKLAQLEAYKMEADEGKEINAELKAENEELKKTVDDLLHKPEIQDKILWKIDNEALLGSKDAYIYKLEKTLTEIKEIAERCGKRIPLFEIDEIAEDLKQILQKISEVENGQ